MSATIVQFPQRKPSPRSRGVFDIFGPWEPSDRLHAAILAALEGMRVVARRRHGHPLIATAAWDAIEERLTRSSCQPAEFVNNLLGGFYDVSDGPAPPGWRSPDDPRQQQEATRQQLR